MPSLDYAIVKNKRTSRYSISPLSAPHNLDQPPVILAEKKPPTPKASSIRRLARSFSGTVGGATRSLKRAFSASEDSTYYQSDSSEDEGDFDLPAFEDCAVPAPLSPVTAKFSAKSHDTPSFQFFADADEGGEVEVNVIPDPDEADAPTDLDSHHSDSDADMSSEADSEASSESSWRPDERASGMLEVDIAAPGSFDCVGGLAMCKPHKSGFPLANSATPSFSEDDDVDVVKRFQVSYTGRTPPSLVCCVTMPQPPSTSSGDTASRCVWLFAMMAFLLTSTSGFLPASPRMNAMFKPGGAASRASTPAVTTNHNNHNPEHHDVLSTSTDLYTSNEISTDLEAIRDVWAGTAPPPSTATPPHVGVEPPAARPAAREDGPGVAPPTSPPAPPSKAKALAISAVVTKSASAVAKDHRKKAIKLKLKERKAASTIKASTKEYSNVITSETADGVTGELIYATVNHLPIGEAQKVIARSVMASIVFNSTTLYLNGGRLSEIAKEFLNDLPSHAPKFFYRHMLIPALTHGLVHCVAQLSSNMAAHATDELTVLPDCINQGLCDLALQIAEVIPDVPL